MMDGGGSGGGPMKPVSRSVTTEVERQRRLEAGPPPSHPDARRSRPEARDPIDVDDRVARLQMLAALALGVVLVSGSLYVWRRPKHDAELEKAAASQAAQTAALGEPAVATIVKKEALVLVGDPRVVGCQDLGPGKTEGAACGTAEPLAAALKKAIVDNEACLPPSEGAGNIEFVADFQFERKRLTVTAPQSTRTVKSSRAAVGCASAIKRSLLAAGSLSLPHEHPRMKVAAQASYATRSPQ